MVEDDISVTSSAMAVCLAACSSISALEVRVTPHHALKTGPSDRPGIPGRALHVYFSGYRVSYLSGSERADS